MTREELEAALRRNLTETGVPVTYHNTLVDAFLPGADDYARTVGGITAERRRVLNGSDTPVHYGRHAGSQVSACGKISRLNEVAEADITTIVADVTCKSCKRTGTYKVAEMEASC